MYKTRGEIRKPDYEDQEVYFKHSIIGDEENDKVTFVNISVVQDSDVGRAFITKGGIGQFTKRLLYEAELYALRAESN